MVSMNIFRIAGDVSHTISKCILIWAIHTNRSAEGVSLLTQLMYVAVFITRYLDLFWAPQIAWNLVLKLFYISSSVYIIIIMMFVYARTREREKAWKFGTACLAGSATAAPFVMMIFRRQVWSFSEVLYIFSLILESVCVLPQLLLLRETSVPTVIDTFYLLTLGSYRAFYILNWIMRGVNHKTVDPVSVIFGVLQTALYADFAWVYWTRQRVKLRNGGVVDSDDLSRGWLVGKVLGRGGSDFDEENVDGTDAPDGVRARRPVGPKAGWGARGLSVSADEGVLNAQQAPTTKPRSFEREAVTRPEEAVGILADPDSYESDEETQPPNNSTTEALSNIGDGGEWRRENSK